jgi:hypothetical protein
MKNMSTKTENETAGVAAPAAPETQNPTGEVKAEESAETIGGGRGERKHRRTNRGTSAEDNTPEAGLPGVAIQQGVPVKHEAGEHQKEPLTGSIESLLRIETPGKTIDVTLSLADDADPSEEEGYLKTRPLTTQEMDLLEGYEEIIRDGLPTFLAVGRALAEIKRRRLYRTLFKTFQEYCDKRLGMSRAFAHMQAAAAEVMENIMKSGENLPAPTTERQLRPLTGVSAKIQVEAWKVANTLSGGRKVTGQHVEMALKQLVGREQQKEDWLSKSLDKLKKAGYTDGFEQPVTMADNEWVDLYDDDKKLFVKLIDKPTLGSLGICLGMLERGIEFQVVVNGNGLGKKHRELTKDGKLSTVLDPLLSVVIKNLDAFVEFGGELYESDKLGTDTKLTLKPTKREEADNLRIAFK